MTLAKQLDTLKDMREVIQSDLNVSANSSLFPPDTIDSAIGRSYVKAYRLFRWPGTEDARNTVTSENQEYYTIPDDFVPDSMWRLEVDGSMYGEQPEGTPLDFHDYLKWKTDNPNSTDKKWARQWNRYFIYPTPTVADLTISIWGQLVPTKLTNDDDTTIFSYNLPECNEAVVLEAKAMLKSKSASPKDGQFYSVESKSILTISFTRIKQDNGRERKVQPMLDVPDFFRPIGVYQNTGNFYNQE